jgi:hypothetical protein
VTRTNGARALRGARVRSLSRSVAALLIALALATSCRTTRPAGNESALEPLTSGSPQEAMRELSRRLASIHAVRSLMRIRITTAGRTQSFRGQVLVEPHSGRMRLSAYTPIGTEAMTLSSDGDRVTFLDHVNRTAWEGSAAELAQAIGFFDPHTSPAVWALVIIGFPAGGEFEAADRGLARGTIGDVAIAFDPPVFPPHNVTVRSGAGTLEITHLELVSTDANVPLPSIPKDYRCCVAPRM